MRRLGILLCCGLAVIAAGQARAAYPEREIALIVPFGAGGNADLGVRTVEPHLERCLGGAEIVVINKPGASGKIGFAELAQAPADGYTLGLINTPNFYSYPIVEETPWEKDSFELLGSIVGSISTISVRPDSPIESLKDLVALAQDAEKRVNVGLPGIGGGDHLAVLRFADAADVDFNYIPFTDGPTTRNALMGGHIDFTVMSEANAVQFKDEVRALATAREERGDVLPDTPTFKEEGFDVVASSLHIFAAPAGIPDEVRSRIEGCLTEVAGNPEFLADAERRGLILLPMTAAQVAEVVNEEDAYYRGLWARQPWQ
jgi:tripartite-type tricarboxylate transporter receptor subunit TctC